MEGIVPLDDPSRTIVTITPPKSEALFETAIEPEEEELEEGELELAEGEEVPEGEEAAAEETEEESKE